MPSRRRLRYTPAIRDISSSWFVSASTIEARVETSRRDSPRASAFASLSEFQKASYACFCLSRKSSAEAVQYISYVAGISRANMFPESKP